MREQNGDELFANHLQLLIEGHTEGHNGGFEPEFDLRTRFVVGVILNASEFEKGNHHADGDQDGVEEHPPRAPLHHLGQEEDHKGEPDEHKLVVERVDKVISDQGKAFGKRKEQTICGKDHSGVRFDESNLWKARPAPCSPGWRW